jgi:hypothetical protein
MEYEIWLRVECTIKPPVFIGIGKLKSGSIHPVENKAVGVGRGISTNFRGGCAVLRDHDVSRRNNCAGRRDDCGGCRDDDVSRRDDCGGCRDDDVSRRDDCADCRNDGVSRRNNCAGCRDDDVSRRNDDVSRNFSEYSFRDQKK